jgi:hypothetical protein
MPWTSRIIRIVDGLAAMVVVLSAAYGLTMRSWHQRWGATDQEVAMRLPGDDLASGERLMETRAITIDGQPEEVWPWLVQMGYGRAGWYSIDAIDNGGVPSAAEILPQYQDLKVGDRLPITPNAGFPVLAMEPGRSMVVEVMPGCNWSILLQPQGDNQTRLVWRADSPASPPWHIPSQLMSMGAWVMQREALLGLKSRVEGDPRAPYPTAVQLLSLVGALVTGVWAAILYLRRRRWQVPLVLGLASALALMSLPVLGPPDWIHAVVAVILLAGLWWARRTTLAGSAAPANLMPIHEGERSGAL